MTDIISDQFSNIPFFDSLERNKYGKFAKDSDLRKLGKFVLTVTDAQDIGYHVEEIAAAYLVTNMLLMSRASRRIAKCIVLEHTLDGRDNMFSIVNSLRYHACGEYSRLDNFELWGSVSSQRKVTVSRRLSTKLGELSKFLSSSEVSSRDVGQREAETLISVKSPEHQEGQGLYVDTANPFVASFQTKNGEHHEVVSQTIYRQYFTLSVSNSKDVVLIELDGRNASAALEEWLACLDSMLDNNLLGLSV